MWALFVIYAACFGMELTIDNIAALYFTDNFHLGLTAAGFVAGSFGMMNIFARALGGIVSDRCHKTWGLRGRALLLGGTIFCEGLALMLFSQMRWLPLAIGTMMLTGLFIKMSNGATYARGAFRQPESARRGGRNRRRGGQRGFGAGRIPLQGKHAVDAGSALSWERSSRSFLCFRNDGPLLRGGGTLGRARDSRAAFGRVWQQRERWETDMPPSEQHLKEGSNRLRKPCHLED